MFRVSYLENDEIKQKGGFKDTKEAMEFVEKKEKESKNFYALKLLVWDEYLNCYSVLREL